MQRVLSKQQVVPFVFCPSPVTIDKRADWGANADNMQIANAGAFLKLNSDNTVSHLVQPNPDKSAPIGWVKSLAGAGFYDKEPIYIGETVYVEGDIVNLATLDGPIAYEVKEPSVMCYNEVDGKPNYNDSWVQTLTVINKNYIL